ncbi:FG-GAP-like repeat-containing protein [Stieleria sp. TO1_6]|uniref:FG-GAP-like repeat-containing protein n=1 Tax=Stieleria tagensis TaxID=2956795 RepID=UPI00209BAD24|nr:FG-GAP-like repeat-containing protein [Stieleria tagensis]MCO8123734.1 FG-GAP-like repeat-containing protein [Stieleria tagensis]
MTHAPRQLPIAALLLLMIGCDRSEVPVAKPTVTSIQSPAQSLIDKATLAVQQQRWEDADRDVRAAMLEHPGNASVIQLAADVAFANGQMETAVALLVDASVADSFDDESLVRRATVALLAVGKLYEAIDLLDQVVTAYPDRHQTRRDLFDFLINVEDHQRARSHGRRLVRQRQFDRELLFSLSTNEQRDMEGNSMAELVKRNPSDTRLEIATARLQFDSGRWEDLEPTLLRILESDNACRPAQLLFGRYLVQTSQYDRLGRWSQRLPSDVEDTWQYWAVLGDWAGIQSDHQTAARAYWESTRRNPDIGEVFAKLGRTLHLLRSRGEAIPQDAIDAINRRAERLGRFTQDKERFYRFGNRSNAIVVDVARSLVELGRLWEAEAWTAFAMTIPDEHVAAVRQLRQSIVPRLTAQTPWQLTADDPVFELSLDHYPPPSRLQLAQQVITRSDQRLRPIVTPILRDEASERGLVIQATRHADDKQMIPLYAQMESGGCALDFDHDGWCDLYVASCGGTPGQLDSNSNRMFRNLQGDFVDVTESTQTGDQGFSQGVTFGDLNADGFADLVVFNNGRDRVWINNGDGSFTDRSDWLPSNSSDSWSTSGAVADLDGDGISDLVCLKYCSGRDAVATSCQDPKTGLPGPCLPTQLPAEADVVLAGRPAGGFVAANQRWGVVPGRAGRGLGLVVGALDATAGLDIFVANDMTDNHYWSAVDGPEFTLEESATLRGLAFDARFRPQACMGIAAADLDDDGDVDFYVTNFEQEHNAWYEQTDPGIWSDTASLRGIADVSYSMLGFGTQAIDFDNDSVDEIAVTNGHVYRSPDPPASYSQPLQILHQVAAQTYQEVDLRSQHGYVSKPHVGRAMWMIDADRDGRTDLAITHQNEPLALLINRTPTHSHWINIQLVGVRCSRDAIGAHVSVSGNGIQRMAALNTGDGFFCANQRQLHFGLGDQINLNQRLSVTVDWPDGSHETFFVRPDSDALIVQGNDVIELTR